MSQKVIYFDSNEELLKYNQFIEKEIELFQKHISTREFLTKSTINKFLYIIYFENK